MQDFDEPYRQIYVLRNGIRAAILPTLSYIHKLFLITVIVFILMAVYTHFTNKRDSTDFAEGPRSGMRLHTDAFTGCQYLSFPSGGVTPRLTTTGGHLGCRH